MNPQNSPTSPTSAGASGFGGTATQGSGALTETKNKLTETAREAASKVKSTVSETASRAKGEAERIVNEKKETAAERIGGYSQAIHDSARSIEEKDPNIAWFTHQAADKLQNVADYMRNSDLLALRTDVEGLARRHPAAFFGGLFVAGLLLGNAVKATSRNTLSSRSNSTDTADDDNMALGLGSEGSTGSYQAGSGSTDLSATERSSAGI